MKLYTFYFELDEKRMINDKYYPIKNKDFAKSRSFSKLFKDIKTADEWSKKHWHIIYEELPKLSKNISIAFDPEGKLIVGGSLSKKDLGIIYKLKDMIEI